MNTSGLLILIIAVILAFFIAGAIMMVLYNYTVPRLAESVNKNYNRKTDFKPISYWTACTLALLCSLAFGSVTVASSNIGAINSV